MRLSFGLCLWLVCAPLAAMTGEDPPTQLQPAQATPTTQSSTMAIAASPAATTTPPGPSAPPVHSDKVQVLTADEKLLLSRGYRRETHEGQAVYCRKETVVGSHFEKKVCGTPEQIAAAVRVSKDVTEQSQRQNNPLPMNDFQLEHK